MPPPSAFAAIRTYFKTGSFGRRKIHFGICTPAPNVLLIGKLLGPIPLGIYAVARQIAAIPAQKMTMVVKPAAFPAFAMVQHDRSEALRYLRKATRLIALASFPIFFGISAIAPQIVEIFLGPRWASAVVPLRLLALSMTLNSVRIHTALLS